MSLWEGALFCLGGLSPCDTRSVLVGMGVSLGEGVCSCGRRPVLQEACRSVFAGVNLYYGACTCGRRPVLFGVGLSSQGACSMATFVC